MPLPRRVFLLASLPLLAACATATRPAADTRTVDSAQGPVAVPAAPQRVVCLDLSKIQRMLDVDLRPVGVVQDWQPLDQYADWYARAPKIGTQAAPDLEAIAALRPDLLLGSPQGVDDGMYARLSGLAPTVLLAARGLGAGWKQLSAADAAAAGRGGELDAVARRYDQRVAALRATHAAALARLRVAALYGIPDGAYTLRAESGPGVVLSDLGVHLADPAPGIYQQISTEELAAYASADLVLVDAHADGGLSGATRQLLAGPTFTALPGRAVPLSHLLVFSYGEALALLDQLDAVLRGAR